MDLCIEESDLLKGFPRSVSFDIDVKGSGIATLIGSSDRYEVSAHTAEDEGPLRHVEIGLSGIGGAPIKPCIVPEPASRAILVNEPGRWIIGPEGRRMILHMVDDGDRYRLSTDNPAGTIGTIPFLK